MKTNLTKLSVALLFTVMFFAFSPVKGQQFNSDNYLAKPKGMATIILTTGQRNTMFMATFSLLRNWEFTTSAYLYNDDGDPLTGDGHSMSLYAKYMFYENKAKTGGFAVKFGTGLDPGYLGGDDRVNDAFKSYWMNAPVTFPFLGYIISWDVMPGVSVTRNFGEENTTAWAFTYATRLAVYPGTPKFSFVGELYGTVSKSVPNPEYRVGLRWEPSQHAVFALSYDGGFRGNKGGGFEIGLMLFTPPFFAIGDFDKK